MRPGAGGAGGESSAWCAYDTATPEPMTSATWRRNNSSTSRRMTRTTLRKPARTSPGVLHDPPQPVLERHGCTPVPGSPRERGIKAAPRDITGSVRSEDRFLPVFRGGRHGAKQLEVRHFLPPPDVGADPRGSGGC